MKVGGILCQELRGCNGKERKCREGQGNSYLGGNTYKELWLVGN